jgi:hypothetical protein
MLAITGHKSFGDVVQFHAGHLSGVYQNQVVLADGRALFDVSVAGPLTWLVFAIFHRC